MNKSIIISLVAVLLVAGISSAYASTPREGAMEGFSERRIKMKDSESFNQVQEALTNRDYQTWSELMAGRGILQKVTEENFEQFVQMHELMQDGKYDEASEMREQMGVGSKRRMGNGNGMGKGMHRNR